MRATKHTKHDLIQSLSQDTLLPLKYSQLYLDTIMANIATWLASGDQVALPGIGVLAPVARSSRRVRHPRTGKMIRTPERIRIKFRPSKPLRNVLATNPYDGD